MGAAKNEKAAEVMERWGQVQDIVEGRNNRVVNDLM